MSNAIASITVLVHSLKGIETVNHVVPFRVYRQKEMFIAVPFINHNERQTAGLPETLSFEFINNRIVPGKEGNIDVLNNIVKELKLLHIV